MEIKPNAVFHQRYSVVRPLTGTPPGGLYLGRDITLEQAVLIKFRQSGGAASDQMFLKSAAKLKELDHPNLARVVDFFVAEGLQALVMDYIPGDNLVTFIQQYGALTLPELEPWVQKLGDALAYLHSQKSPAIHGDIRPTNLILTPESELILINYGMPELGVEPLPEDQAAFAAPEYEEKTAKVSSSVDQYGLAATLYYLLTKQAPPSSYQRQVEGAGITPLHTLRPQIPASLHATVAKAMALRSQDRHASIKDFSSAFLSAGKASAARLSSTQPSQPPFVAAPPAPAAQPAVAPAPLPQAPVMQAPPPAPNVKKKKPLSALVIIIISLIAVGMLIGGIILMVNLVRADAIASASDPSTWPTVTPKAVTPTVTLQPTADSSANLTPLSGNTVIAYASNVEDGATFQIWLMGVGSDESGNIQLLGSSVTTSGTGNKSQPAWSPDGQVLIFVSETLDSNLETDIFMMQEDSQIFDATQKNGSEHDPVFSPDGKYLAFSSSEPGSNRTRIFLSEDIAVYSEIESVNMEFSPTWSSDGEVLLYVTQLSENDNRLYYRLKSENFSTPHPFDEQFRQGNVLEVEWAPDGNTIAYTVFDPVSYALYIYTTNWSSHGAEIQQLTFSGGDYAPSFSPDSKWIIYTSLQDGNSEIYIMRSDGSQQTNLTNSPFEEREPVWQPVPYANLVEEPDIDPNMILIDEGPIICRSQDTDSENNIAYCVISNPVIPQGDTLYFTFHVASVAPDVEIRNDLYDSNGNFIDSNTFEIEALSGANNLLYQTADMETGDYYFSLFFNGMHYGDYWFTIIPETGGGGGE